MYSLSPLDALLRGVFILQKKHKINKKIIKKIDKKYKRYNVYLYSLRGLSMEETTVVIQAWKEDAEFFKAERIENKRNGNRAHKLFSEMVQAYKEKKEKE
jgi:hypothetical protein